jgi:hypothetical protein
MIHSQAFQDTKGFRLSRLRPSVYQPAGINHTDLDATYDSCKGGMSVNTPSDQTRLIDTNCSGMGSILDVWWAQKGIVMAGYNCTAQGVIQQFGEVGVALIILVRLTFIIMSFRLRTADVHFISFLPSTLS